MIQIIFQTWANMPLYTAAVSWLTHIKVHSCSTETSWCLYCMKTVEQKRFVPSNRPRCDLGLPFKERLPSPSNTQEFFHCVGIALEHCIQSQLRMKSSHWYSMWSHLSTTHKTKKRSGSKHQHSEWNLKLSHSKIYPYSSVSSLWFLVKHSKSLPPFNNLCSVTQYPPGSMFLLPFWNIHYLQHKPGLGHKRHKKQYLAAQKHLKEKGAMELVHL